MIHLSRKQESFLAIRWDRALLAELIGTFMLVLIGTGAIVANDLLSGQIGVVGIGLAFGLVVMAMVYILGPISGAHINPSVTIALWSSGHFPGRLVVPYVFSQSIGALIASSIVKVLCPAHATLGTTIPAGSLVQSFVIEFLLTFVLVSVILAVSRRAFTKRIGPAILIGSVVGFASILAGPISGASMNPARSLGPAVISGQLRYMWIYLIAPTAGALAAVPINQFMFAVANSFAMKNSD